MPCGIPNSIHTHALLTASPPCSFLLYMKICSCPSDRSRSSQFSSQSPMLHAAMNTCTVQLRCYPQNLFYLSYLQSIHRTSSGAFSNFYFYLRRGGRVLVWL